MRAPRIALALLLTISLGCAQKDWIDRTLVTENVTGGWAGSVGEGNSYRYVRLDLQQEGTKVTGFATFSLSGTFPLQGSMAGDVFTFNSPRGTASGELMVSGDDMSGKISWVYGTSRMSLHRVESLSQTKSPPR